VSTAIEDELELEPVMLAGHIQWWRERLGVSRRTLAIRMDVHPGLVEAWEMGTPVDRGFLRALAVELHVSVATLLERSGEPPPPGTRAFEQMRLAEERRHAAEQLDREALEVLARRRAKHLIPLPLGGQLHGPLLGQAQDWYGRPHGGRGLVGRW
jgi:transcriptional regulator with XRE-family HTH domain